MLGVGYSGKATVFVERGVLLVGRQHPFGYGLILLDTLQNDWWT